MTRYFLGIDTGATKSHALVADEAGHAVGLGTAGAGNWEVVGWDGLAATLNAVTGQALAKAGIRKDQIAGLGLGIAGYDWPSQDEPTRQAIGTLGIPAPCAFVNDTTLGLIAGATQGWGVAVVAGTSCNCRGRGPDGREGRVTGEGWRFAEFAGAGELVAKAIGAVSLAWSLRGPATRLSDAFIGLTGATDVADLLEGLAVYRYDLSAEAAPWVFQVAAEGDAVAQELIRWAGQELGSLAIGVIRQLGLEQMEFEVVLIGSMFKGGPALAAALAETVHTVAPGARLLRLAAPPVVGAVLLAMQQAALETAPLRRMLIDAASELAD